MHPAHLSDFKIGVLDAFPLCGTEWRSDAYDPRPVPDGFFAGTGADGVMRLHKRGGCSSDCVSSARTTTYAASVPSAPTYDIDALLAEAKAAGWRPNNEYLACGGCTPCRNGSRSQCVQPNSPRAFANARERARMQAEHEERELLAGRGWAPAGADVDVVESVQDVIARGAKAATREAYG